MDNIISPIPEQLLPDKLIVVSSESVKNELLKSAKRNNLILKSQKKFSDAFYYYNFGKIGLIGLVMGSPAAAIAVEPFLASGLKKLIILGYVGGIAVQKKQINIGDIIFPTASISDEGTSKIYGATAVITSNNFSFQNEIITAVKEKISLDQLKFGPIWTTDAPYRENKSRANYFCKQGAIAVDMEYSLLCHLANLYNAEIAGCFVVSDLVGFERKRGFKNPTTKNSINILIEILISK